MKILSSQKTITEAWSEKPNALSVASIGDKYIRANTAKLLENQDRWVKKQPGHSARRSGQGCSPEHLYGHRS